MAGLSCGGGRSEAADRVSPPGGFWAEGLWGHTTEAQGVRGSGVSGWQF